MRRLILMRHAKSNWSDPAQRDLDRPLNKRGRRAAGLLGGWLKEKGYLPEQALVSSARRAQETWAGVVAVAGAAPTSYVPEIYHAAPETLLAVLRAAPDVASVLMLGHQPGIGAFLRRLLDAAPDDPAFERFPTGATAVIDFDVPGWPAVGWGKGRLVDFVVPRGLES
ncbi:histidine phosphatase family protein [Amaricoccus sp.]|uniref:SixA phosphatase family protein n=1 Tax=Amaricoccus sp. TaxID=1872485 RepID=UPI00262F618A|nr:histidine phosphatase family protein [Amaricoccus sp.]HRO11018.1 histidine phosphatase family protein [Amaricoccus sp.]